jgi:nucleoside phosphorylase
MAGVDNPIHRHSNDYTIGWICAITTEYVAAQVLLDELHEGLENVSPHDNNVYTLGKIGKHNVVIAVLPDGEYGLSSAASLARDMLRSFPNVRVGLLVGIGGGAPSRRHDIRLGDVVVSAPGDGYGGVFQYDFGKTIQDQNFQPTRVLDQPPVVLRIAMTDLMARYEIEGHQLEKTINGILEKNPRLQRKYKRPEPSSDRLFKAEITHDSACATACGDSPSNFILRPERTKDEDNPAIHYGLIASANQVMRNAVLRDKFSTDMDVLCFEMEAAGLMNDFPCIIIRGICDYSDSHKNKEWQGYAAMAAAVYAKDLLCQVPLRRVDMEKKVVDILTD